MSRDMQPLFWRINEQDRHGLEAISLLMPTDESSNAALEMPTNIKLYGAGRQAYPMDLRWSEEDQDLFMCLLERVAGRELEGDIQRSEEHTSELQSRPHLVCRLLLEKKNEIILVVLFFIKFNHSYQTSMYNYLNIHFCKNDGLIYR